MEEDPASGGTGTPTIAKTPTTDTTPPLFGSNIMRVRTAEELSKIAGNQIDAEINDAVSPLTAQIGTLTDREGRAVKSIQDMFGQIQPWAQEAATAVGTSYDQARADEQGIFEAANSRMTQLKQSRAQEAQALAQEMGGPVSVGEFTSSMGVEPEALTALGAGQQLHTLAFGQAAVGEANAFAGRVLPLLSTEQQSQARSYYEDQITELNKQITDLKAQRGTKVNAKLNELLVQERTFQLDKAQQALDKLKANRDWIASKKTLAQQKKTTDMAVQEFQLEKAKFEAEQTGLYKGKLTQAAKAQAAQIKHDADVLGLSRDQYRAQKSQFLKQWKLDNQKQRVALRSTWAQMLDAAVSPTPGKTISSTKKIYVPRDNLNKDVHPELDNKGRPTGKFYILKDVTEEVKPGTAMSEPNHVVDYLTSNGVPKQIAVNMVKSRFNIPNWTYGARDPRLPPQKSGPPAPGKSGPGPYKKKG